MGGLLVGVLMASEFMLVQLTSAVALNVASSLHNIPVAVAGVFFFNEHIYLRAGIGFCVGLVGAMLYTLDRYRSDQLLSPEIELHSFKAVAVDCSDVKGEDEGSRNTNWDDSGILGPEL